MNSKASIRFIVDKKKGYQGGSALTLRMHAGSWGLTEVPQAGRNRA